MLGYIYKITNLISGKIYIGQTTKSPQIRFKEHFKSRKSYISNSMRKYGLDCFELTVLEEIEAEPNELTKLLDDREVFYISKYDSFNTGYNKTLGGKGNPILVVAETQICNDYLSGMSVPTIAKRNRVSEHKIINVLDKHNITRRDYREAIFLVKGAFSITAEFADHTETFISYREAAEYLVKKEIASGRTIHSLSTLIRRAVLSRKPAFSAVWSCERYSEKDYILHSLLRKSENKKRKNKPKINADSKHIKDKEKRVSIERKTKCPPKEVLLKIIKDNNWNFTAVGKIYGVTGNSVKKWCIKNNIESHSRIGILNDKQKHFNSKDKILELFIKCGSISEVCRISSLSKSRVTTFLKNNLPEYQKYLVNAKERPF